MAFRGIHTKMVSYPGHNGDKAEAYYAYPDSPGKFPGVVILHHMPGWDEWTTEVVHKFAHHGYAAIAQNLYFRVGDGAKDEVVAKVRTLGGVPDDQLIGDTKGAIKFMRDQSHASGKVAVIGFCSGGRQTIVAASNIPDIDAAIDCWGGRVVVDSPKDLTPTQPVAPLDMVGGIRCPVLGLFGNEDTSPSPAHVNRLEEELKKLGKTYEFHRYDNAGHAFFATYRVQHYRVEPALDGWNKVFAFLGKNIGPGAPL